MRLLSSLSRTVRQMELPFGYGLTVWSSGFIAVDRFGAPKVDEIFLFVGGAVSGYLLCAGLAYRHLDEPMQEMGTRPSSVLNVFSLVAAVVVGLVARAVDEAHVGFGLAGLAGTVTYILSISAFMALGQRTQDPGDRR